MEKEGYAISNWHDTGEILDKIDALTSHPMRMVRKEAMDAYLDYFSTRCPGSKKMVDEAKNYIPGGVQHNLAFNYPFPIVINKAGGPTLLGSDYKPAQEKVMQLIKECGPVTGLFNEYELKIARLIKSTCRLSRCSGCWAGAPKESWPPSGWRGTGFRQGLGGAQGYFGIKPDLTVFGKIVAGGYPGAGGVGGRKDLIMLLAAGLEAADRYIQASVCRIQPGVHMPPGDCRGHVCKANQPQGIECEKVAFIYPAITYSISSNRCRRSPAAPGLLHTYLVCCFLRKLLPHTRYKRGQYS